MVVVAGAAYVTGAAATAAPELPPKPPPEPPTKPPPMLTTLPVEIPEVADAPPAA